MSHIPPQPRINSRLELGDWFYVPAKWHNWKHRGGTWRMHIFHNIDKHLEEVEALKKVLLAYEYPVKVETQYISPMPWFEPKTVVELRLGFRAAEEAVHFKLCFLDE